MDVHVPYAITTGLRLRGVDVLTAQEDGTRRFLDAILLDRATTLGRVLFSQDEDLLSEAAQRQYSGQTFAGVIYAHQLKVTIGQCINDLELIACVGEPEEFANRVEYLPLRESLGLLHHSLTSQDIPLHEVVKSAFTQLKS
jgi:predicted nuclease of predicted toxin-antitoxin system